MRRLELDELINIQMKLQDHCDSYRDCEDCPLADGECIIYDFINWGGGCNDQT